MSKTLFCDIYDDLYQNLVGKFVVNILIVFVQFADTIIIICVRFHDNVFFLCIM